jgi:AcrR family transcriptional regulator
MDRARSQILAAAGSLVAEAGLRAVTMAALARRARVAKATVYNHFRDRDEVLRALLHAERDALLAHCAEHPRGERLDAAARWIGEHPVLTGLRAHDPAVVIGLASAAVHDPHVAEQVAAWAGPSRDTAATTRWLVSFAVTASSR